MDDETGRRAYELAREYHRAHLENNNILFQATVNFGLEAIRTAALVNGGAVIGCLTFLGNLHESQTPDDKALIATIGKILVICVIGAIASGIASGCAYFAQYCYGRASEEAILSWDHPYVAFEATSITQQRIGAFWHYIAGAMVLASYGALITGVAHALPFLWHD